ncbi:Stp1/IreP family PP2C-type Ser/Thr phosphatase [Clostridium rectalis]|uniref:Stp1/IreP family PP2C-type Ser/Thr phosphatase n=1 Tax=Clostridium rectalis TaxID=2040295 RepID=UPI000F62F74A|nr:Stp1/IreP family PP2C-type Ser/Thr phosphatase [Clostridium rectalis]
MVGMLSDIGNFRRINEDSVGYYEGINRRVYVIADGMGGHNAGEVASKLAVDTIIEYIKKSNEKSNLEQEVIKAIEEANNNIYIMGQKDRNLEGMGTTVTVCVIENNDVIIANVGDSSCYIIDNKKNIIKITKDHSLVQQLIDNGSITEQEAISHPNKNIITRALGTNKSVKVDTFILDRSMILKIILCTDGLTNDVTPKEMCDIIINNDNKESCKLLVELSKIKGGRDNISVIVVEGECKDDRNFTGK